MGMCQVKSGNIKFMFTKKMVSLVLYGSPTGYVITMHSNWAK